MINQLVGRSFAVNGRTKLAVVVNSTRPSASVLDSPLSTQYQYRYHTGGTTFQHKTSGNAFALTAATFAAASGILLGDRYTSKCESSKTTDCTTDNEKEEEDLPTYTMEQVSKNNGMDGRRVWMTYGGNVYDTTDFIVNHPGGSEKILLAAGGAIEPHWHLYRQHFASDLPQQLMEKMVIGTLHPDDQEKIDNEMEVLTDDEENDPYGHEPTRSSSLIVHGDTPMNAEVRGEILGQSYITPASEFYIRHHHPVPLLSEQDVKDFRLDVDLSLLSKKPKSWHDEINKDKQTDHQTAKLSLEQIKSLPKVEITTTLQCSGNRRSGFNDFKRTSGTPWGQGAISTAKWGGARLSDVLMLASQQLEDTTDVKHSLSKDTSTTCKLPQTLQNLHTLLDEHPTLQHLRFESLDGMKTSISTSKAFNPFGDVILAYEMNEKDLPRDHGYPLRVIVPGYAAVRNVKWLSKLELAEEESEGIWQRALNYKVLPPSVVDAKEVDLDKMPGLSEVSVFSGITQVSRAAAAEKQHQLTPGETVMVKASGWAWAGGGRNIVRVDISGNGGKSWTDANITQGSDQPYGRAWAWVLWECDNIPAIVCEDGKSVELSCKGVDMAFNTQPESSDGMWNVRGLGNNSWYRVRYDLV